MMPSLFEARQKFRFFLRKDSFYVIIRLTANKIVTSCWFPFALRE